MSKHILYCLALTMSFLATGQDIHFSQVNRTEFLTNPAFSGTFNGNIKATLNWKDQWQSVNNTFRTYATSAEISFGKARPRKPTFYAIGMYAAKDVSGDIELGNTTVGANFSSLFRINRNQRLCFGLQGAYGTAGINASAAQWGNQYNGLSFDPTLYDGEGIEYLPSNYWDFSAGLAWWYHKNDRNVVVSAPQDGRIGFSIYHINRPENAFAIGQTSNIPMRAVFHASGLFGTPITDLYWFPNLTAQFQSTQHEIVGGVIAKYILSSGSKMTGYGTEMALAAGFSVRVNNVFDAFIPQIFLDFQSFSLGLSYDVNFSRLRSASAYRGGFELSLRFTNPDGFTHKNPYRSTGAI